MLRTRQRLSDPPAGLPTWFTWDYDLGEQIADAAVHASGLFGGIVGAVMLAAAVLPSGVLGDSAAILVYLIGLLTTLGLSATYNLWPVSPMKWVLRRFDHSTIYLFIAATYTPSADHERPLDRRLARLHLGFRACRRRAEAVLAGPASKSGSARLRSMFCLAGLACCCSDVCRRSRIESPVGGLSTGIAFHLWDRLRFQNAIWHLFVLLAAGAHYFAVLTCIAEI